MAKVTNLRPFAVTLPSGLVVPRLGDLTTDNNALREIDNARAIPALIGAGDIAVEYDPDPETSAEQAAALAPIETPAEPVAEASEPKTLKGA